MDVDSYLARIRWTGDRAPTRETLFSLQRAHMLCVPFENLDIHLGREIVLADDLLFDKIVRRHRGGFCYELNGLFGIAEELYEASGILQEEVAHSSSLQCMQTHSNR